MSSYVVWAACLPSKEKEVSAWQNMSQQPIRWVDWGTQMAPGHGWVATHSPGKVARLRLDTGLCVASAREPSTALMHHRSSLFHGPEGGGGSELEQEILSCNMKSGQHCHAIPDW